jgi:hypothetical protein
LFVCQQFGAVPSLVQCPTVVWETGQLLLYVVCMPAVWYSALQLFERLDSCCCMLFVCQQFGTVLCRCLRDWTAAVVCCLYVSSLVQCSAVVWETGQLLLCVVYMPVLWNGALQVFERLDSCCCMLFVCQQFGMVLYSCLRDWTAAVVCCLYASSLVQCPTVVWETGQLLLWLLFFLLFWGLTGRCQADTVLILLDNYCLSLFAGTVSCTWTAGCIRYVR